MPFERTTVFFRDHPRFGPTYQKVSGQPGWVVKLALKAALLVVVVPIVLLVLAALVVAAAVFTVGSALATVLGWFSVGGDPAGKPAQRRPQADDGRENVRVMRG